METEANLTLLNIQNIKNLAEDMPDCLRHLVQVSKWRKVAVTKNGYSVHTLNNDSDSGNRNLTALITGTFQASVDKVLREVFEDIEHLPKWNPQVQACKIIETLDSNTDILHQLTKGLGGFISSREFILLRRLKEFPGSSCKTNSKSYVLAMKSVSLEEYPETSGLVRGENNLCGWLLSEGEDEGTTKFEWITDVDPKLSEWLPFQFVENSMLSVLSQTVESFNDFVQF